MTKTCLSLLVISLAACSPAAAASAQENAPKDKMIELFGDPVIAKGKGIEIKRSQLDSAMVSLRAAAAGRNQPLPPNAESLILRNLINSQVLLSKATEADRTRGKQLLQEALERMKGDSKLTDAEFNERMNVQIKSQGMTREEWDKQSLDQTTIQASLERELKVEVTDAQARKFYDDNLTRFEQPEMVRASHVLVATRDLTTNQDYSDEKKAEKRKLAEDVRKRAKAGEDFAKLAKDHSDDPGSKNTGGEYTFPRGQMVPAFEAAAFSLGTNEVSDVVITEFGYHVIKVSEKIPAKTVEFAKVQKDLKEDLKQQELQKLAPDYIKKLVADANMQILDEKLKLPEEPTAQPSPQNAPATSR